jgi:polysaccharide pyruvyl transferase CsaB
MKTIRIGISGSYGGLNLGDEAILQVIVDLLRKSLGEVDITVFSKKPDDTRKRHKIDRALPVRSMSRDEILPEIKDLDVFILGGGGILINGEANHFMREVMIAKESGVPVVVYAVSAGPLTDIAEQNTVRKWLNEVDILTVREKPAKRTLEDIGVTKEILVTVDPAVLLQKEEIDDSILQSENLGDGRYIGISIREPGPAAQVNVSLYYSYIAHAADYMIERYNHEVAFVPIERDVSDLQISHRVVSQMLNPQKAIILKGAYSPGQLLSLVSKNFLFGVGMRLHFLIFLANAGVPFAPLPYASKVEGFIQSLDITPPPAQLNPGKLIAYIDKMWDERKRLDQKIKTGMQVLRKKAVEANEMIVAFIKDHVAKWG